MEILEYLIENYGYDEPIFYEEIVDEISFMSLDAMKNKLKLLLDNKDLYEYMDEIYFLPNPKSYFGIKTLSINKILRKKYIYEKNKTVGYVSGIYFANQLRLTTQNPAVIEIVTNKEEMKENIVFFKHQKVILRKPRVVITEENSRLLQVLDLINDFEKVSDKRINVVKVYILDYLKDIMITEKEFISILQNYNNEVTKKLMDSGLYNDLKMIMDEK